MKQPMMLSKAIRTLLYSWGGDTPPEAIWTLQELTEWLNEEFGLALVSPTEEDYYNGDGTAFEKKMEIIRGALKLIESEKNDG